MRVKIFNYFIEINGLNTMLSITKMNGQDMKLPVMGFLLLKKK